MPKTLHVVARLRAKDGQHEALKAALSLLVAPSRRELACYQYDLLQSTTDPRNFCFVERWDGEAALERHGASDHVKRAGEQIKDLIEAPPDIQRFELV